MLVRNLRYVSPVSLLNKKLDESENASKAYLPRVSRKNNADP